MHARSSLASPPALRALPRTFPSHPPIQNPTPLRQGFETGIPLVDIDFFLAVSIAFTLFAAINEGSGKFVDEDE